MKPSAPTQAAIPRTATASAPGPRPRAVTRLRGFTLVEVLVALAIVALSLITASQVGGAWVFNANRQWQYQLAQVCADNALIAVRLSTQMPGIGERSVDCLQAERSLRVVLTVRPTPNPAFRRVEAQVWEAQTPLIRVQTVVGRF
ncbi:MAG: prepilin-type N-terminal cleavage/methylation domain-containing protein [Betaproteobacteria bacterium]|nr:prepilin-type N-terminal cleavage/methylation domain-containing protein [Betaproteobacteria bacterium]NBY05038.1 prepilin-type N-terminal cleavage/methylation domain-containing protein [Betaproteobacteria bacterium]